VSRGGRHDAVNLSRRERSRDERSQGVLTMARASCNPTPILALALALTSTLAAAQTMNHGAMTRHRLRRIPGREESMTSDVLTPSWVAFPVRMRSPPQWHRVARPTRLARGSICRRDNGHPVPRQRCPRSRESGKNGRSSRQQTGCSTLVKPSAGLSSSGSRPPSQWVEGFFGFQHEWLIPMTMAPRHPQSSARPRRLMGPARKSVLR
jgi:hypothetical protein